VIELRRDVNLLKWMTGTVLALLVAIAVKIFIHGG
jgi:hypothetical protein